MRTKLFAMLATAALVTTLSSPAAHAAAELFISTGETPVVRAFDGTANQYHVSDLYLAELFAEAGCAAPTCGTVTATQSTLFLGWWALGSGSNVKALFGLVKVGPAVVDVLWRITDDDSILQSGNVYAVSSGMGWSSTATEYTFNGATVSVSANGEVTGDLAGLLQKAAPEFILSYDYDSPSAGTAAPPIYLYPASFPAIGVSWDNFPPNLGNICGFWYPVPGKGACQTCTYTTTNEQYDPACTGRFWQREVACFDECDDLYPLQARERTACELACIREFWTIYKPHQTDPCFQRRTQRYRTYRNCWPFAD